MTRQEIQDLVVRALRQIQQQSGREVPEEITGETRPIGDLDGFDSLNGAELGAILSETFPLAPQLNPCASEDRRRALRVREIVDRLEALVAGEGEDSNE